MLVHKYKQLLWNEIRDFHPELPETAPVSSIVSTGTSPGASWASTISNGLSSGTSSSNSTEPGGFDSHKEDLYDDKGDDKDSRDGKFRSKERRRKLVNRSDKKGINKVTTGASVYISNPHEVIDVPRDGSSSVATVVTTRTRSSAVKDHHVIHQVIST